MPFSKAVMIGQDEDIEAYTCSTVADDVDVNELSTSLLNNVECSSNTRSDFKAVGTIHTGIILLFCMVSLLVLSAVVPVECDRAVRISCPMKPISLLLYLHCLFWGISLICDQHIQYHHLKVRRRGYLEFYNKTRTLSQLPFWTVSTWSTLLLTTATILQDHCPTETACGETIRLNKTDYIAIIIGLEAIILTGTLIVYMRHVWIFNTLKSAPDVVRDDIMSSTLDFGSNSAGGLDEEVYERQADMIHYYKEHNAMLRKTVMELHRQLAGTASPSSS